MVGAAPVNYVRALLYTAAAAAVTVLTFELAREAQQRYSSDVEIRVRHLVSVALREREIDRTVRRLAPYVTFAAYELTEQAAKQWEQEGAHDDGD